MLDKKLRRRIERAFYEYSANKEYGAESIVELAERGLTAKYGVVCGGGGAGNPTEDKAIKATEGDSALLWCKVVEKTLSHFRDTGKDTLIRLKYLDKHAERRIYESLYIDRRTMFLWLEDVLIYAAMLALQYQILRID